MSLRIAYPRLFAILLTLLTASIVTYVVVAQEGDPSGAGTQVDSETGLPSSCKDVPNCGFTIVPADSGETPIPLPQLTDDQEARAIDVLQSSGMVESINGDQDWEVVYPTPGEPETVPYGPHGQAPEVLGDAAPGEATAASIWVVWNEPVDTSGPWTILFCEGAAEHHSEALWHDVRAVNFLIDIRNERVVQIAAGALTVDLGGWLDPGAADEKPPACFQPD